MSLSLFMDDPFGERYTSSHREETKEEIDDAETMFFDALETPPKPVVAHFLDADPVDVVVERLPSPMNISVDGDSVSDSDSAATASDDVEAPRGLWKRSSLHAAPRRRPRTLVAVVLFAALSVALAGGSAVALVVLYRRAASSSSSSSSSTATFVT